MKFNSDYRISTKFTSIEQALEANRDGEKRELSPPRERVSIEEAKAEFLRRRIEEKKLGKRDVTAAEAKMHLEQTRAELDKFSEPLRDRLVTPEEQAKIKFAFDNM